MANQPETSPLQERTADFWSKAADADFRERHAATNWTGHVEVQRYVNRICSGHPDRTWLDHFCDTYRAGRRPREVVNLGCGEGVLERELAARDFADSYVGYDLSAACIERAMATVAREYPQVRFVCADVDHIELPWRAYDVAIFSHALHHVERLEQVCEQVRGALRPEGFLLVQEFIGPSRMQWTDAP